jgi:hypothetical protein
MPIRLRVKNFNVAPAPATTLLYSKPTFLKSTKVNIGGFDFDLWDSLNETVGDINNNKNLKLLTFCDIFKNLSMFNIRFGVGAGAVGVEAVAAAPRYCYNSTKILRLLVAPAPTLRHCLIELCWQSLPR